MGLTIFSDVTSFPTSQPSQQEVVVPIRLQNVRHFLLELQQRNTRAHSTLLYIPPKLVILIISFFTCFRSLYFLSPSLYCLLSLSLSLSHAFLLLTSFASLFPSSLFLYLFIYLFIYSFIHLFIYLVSMVSIYYQFT